MVKTVRSQPAPASQSGAFLLTVPVASACYVTYGSDVGGKAIHFLKEGGVADDKTLAG